MALGETLRMLRKGRRLTQKAFAKEFEISESVVSLYESNKRSPNYAMLLKMADYYGVSCDYLLGHTDYVVGSLTLGGVEQLRMGLESSKTVEELRKNLAEAVMNRTFLSDDNVVAMRDFAISISGKVK